ncbi:fibrinogen-like protein A isoform X3 [Apostichopus japonicus]|uniref:fibrinogen-like protein A isoform X3 n=2 Tax=Stichopus japonicus TaxID=307972 RepID=UPI003AB845B8
MKLSKLTIIKLLMVHLVTTALTKAHYDGYRGTFKCTNSNTREEKATNMYSSKPVETTPKQTTSSETSGSTVREATNLSSSKPVETTPKQTTSSETSGSTVKEAHEQVSSSQPVESTTIMTTAAKSCTKIETINAQGSSDEMKDCLDVFNAGNTTDGIYTIKPTNWNGASFDVFCNMTDGGGWTVFQRRVNGSVGFYRNWNSYKEGFGDPRHEFWLGNDKLSHLTNQGDYEIRIDVVSKDGFPYYAKYDLFRVKDECDNYKLSELGAYTRTADTDNQLDKAGLEYHRHQAFSTYDRDNDNNKAGNCAETYHGAWWYKHCHRSNLNGDYHAVDDNPEQGKRGVSITWKFLPGDSHNIKYTEMKIRPV